MGADIYRFSIKSSFSSDPRSRAFLSDAHALGFHQLETLIVQDIYFIEGELAANDLTILARNLLSDPLTETVEFSRLDETPENQAALSPGSFFVEVAYHPGVTDPVAEQIIRAAHVLDIPGVEKVATARRFDLQGCNLTETIVQQLAERLLANATIQWYSLGKIRPVFPLDAESTGTVEHFPIRSFQNEDLEKLSRDRRAALDLNEMLAIQGYFQKHQRDITDLEFETIAQTWSEHCVHKTFKAQITVQNPQNSQSHWQEPVIDNLLKTYLSSATRQINPSWLLSAFVDNAGIVRFDNSFEVSFKVETHNHPSAIEPFGGANTGVGGVIRDVIGVSAKPIAATDVLCFGPPSATFEDLPAGVLHPRRIRSGVVAGVQDYGNKIGIPTVSGAILYDPGFTANPLVFCGCVGIAPINSHPRQPQPDDHVIVIGGRTGRDGLRGATFSSMTMDAQTGEVAGASVQIGAPIVEKGLIDVVVLARDKKLYHAITDCGAGGLSSAVGEMASISGADVDLVNVRLKYPGLTPWEIWLSEAQERMVLAISPASLPQFQEICQIYDVEITDIGIFTDTNKLVVKYDGNILLDLENTFLHEGIPQRKLSAILPEPSTAIVPSIAHGLDYAKILMDLLAHPNIATKESIIRIYDHEVQGGTLLKPLTGARDDGPADAVVIKPIGTSGTTALVLGAGINPEYGKENPYRMAISVIDEAIRNAAAVGANPDCIALLDNFCWGDPKNPSTLGSLVEAARGCYDGALYYRSPFISGKDSLNNEYMGTDGQRHAIPPTLLVSSMSVIDDFDHTTTMDFKNAGNPVYLVGDFNPHLQGSHFSLVTGMKFEDDIPGQPENAPGVYRRLYKAIQAGLVNACHDLSEGGLLVSAAEMCIASRLGAELEISSSNPGLDLFGETNGCMLVEVSQANTFAFETLFTGLPHNILGKTIQEPSLVMRNNSNIIASVAIDDLVTAWKSPN